MSERNDVKCPKCGHVFDPEMEFYREQLIKKYGKEWMDNFDKQFEENRFKRELTRNLVTE